MKDGLKEILRSYKNGEIGEAVRLYTEDHKQLEHVPLSERRDRCGDGFIRFTG